MEKGGSFLGSPLTLRDTCFLAVHASGGVCPGRIPGGERLSGIEGERFEGVLGERFEELPGSGSSGSGERFYEFHRHK